MYFFCRSYVSNAGHAALLAEKGEIDAACYVVECNPSTGQCDPKFQAGAYCVPSSGANTCVPGICDPTTYKCEPAPLRDGSDCSTAQTLALTDTCNKGECWDGKCVLKPQTRSCDDYDACTKEDACDSYGKCVGNEVKCYPTNNCTNAYCDKQKGCVFEALPDGTTCGTSLTVRFSSLCSVITFSIPLVTVLRIVGTRCASAASAHGLRAMLLRGATKRLAQAARTRRASTWAWASVPPHSYLALRSPSSLASVSRSTLSVLFSVSLSLSPSQVPVPRAQRVQ